MLDLASKLFTGLVSMTMLLFSSYEGNNPSFSDVFVDYDQRNIRIKTTLVDAFENDFEQIFRSGSPVIITYTLNVWQGKSLISTETYSNTVVYDPMNRFFQADVKSSNIYVDLLSYEELKQAVSEVDIVYEHFGISGKYLFELSAYMNIIELASLDREFDLMLLWNFKKPTITFQFEVDTYEA